MARLLELYRGREVVKGGLKMQAQATRDRLVEIFRKLLEETGVGPIQPSAAVYQGSLRSGERV